MIYRLSRPPPSKRDALRRKIVHIIETERLEQESRMASLQKNASALSPESLKYETDLVRYFGWANDPALQLGQGRQMAIKRKIAKLEDEKHRLFQAMKDHLNDESERRSPRSSSPVAKSAISNSSPLKRRKNKQSD